MIASVLALLLAPVFGGDVSAGLAAVDCDALRAQVEQKVRFCPGGQPPPDAVPAEAIAQRFAPVLWFSPDEPLLDAGPFDVRDGKVPKNGKLEPCPPTGTGQRATLTVPNALPLPASPPEERPVVYYQINEFKDATFKRTAGVPLRGRARLTLRYFLYYRCDAGANAHVHDVESVDLRLAVDRDTASGCVTLRLEKATGHAHALRWLDNVLFLEPHDPVRLPLTVLVEEGKHASSPDRNGDGVFTPGYDVNRNVGEAWGVRDNFGSGLLTVKFSASDAKPRHPSHRVVPPTLDDWNDPLRDYYLQCASPPDSADWGGVYELREATSELAEAVAQAATVPGLRETHFGRSPQADSWLSDAATHVKHHVSLMARWDAPRDTLRGDRGWKRPNELSLSWGTRLPLLPAVVAARAVFSLRGEEPFVQRGDLLLMPTASRWIDTYLALWGAGQGDKPQLLPEAGFRIRLVSKEPPLPLPFKLWKAFPMWGARVGLRLPSLRRALDGAGGESARGVRGVRLVFELGGGAF